MKWNIIVVGVICGIFFESILNPPKAGFYLIPIVISSVVYVLLPFTLSSVNVAIAWLLGVSSMSVWALVITGGHFFSFAYFLHIVIIMTISFVILYATDQKK